MIQKRIIEEQITFKSGDLNLRGILSYSFSGEPECAVLLCSPHPHFAGDLNNNVIQALSEHLAVRSVVLRFNYRGIGGSEINLPEGLSVYDYWTDVEEKKDYKDALEDGRAAMEELIKISSGIPLFVIGYSFGASLALTNGISHKKVSGMIGISPPLSRLDFSFLSGLNKKCFLMCGEGDFVFSHSELDRIKSIAGPELITDIYSDQDHFFRGTEHILCRNMENFIFRDRINIAEDNNDTFG